MLIDHTGLCSLQKKEVPALIIKADPFPGIDPVCIQDNITFLRLPEDFLQNNHREAVTLNQIMKHLSRSHTGKLVHIPHHDQPGSHTDRLQECFEKMDIYHGHFIYNNNVCFQWIFFIPFKFCPPAFLHSAIDLQ